MLSSTKHEIDKFDKPGVYSIKCSEWNNLYINQISRKQVQKRASTLKRQHLFLNLNNPDIVHIPLKKGFTTFDSS